jgi:2,4-dichlorophenol 6-monooxygenase
VPDGTPEPEWQRDRELYYHPTTWPGARLPHVWLGNAGRQVSTLDLAGKGRFSLFTGVNGAAWAQAAADAAERTGVPVEVFVIGPGQAYEDLFGDWATAREVGESGCVLVRPDMHVAWRAQDASRTAGLSEALLRVLGRAAPVQVSQAA